MQESPEAPAGAKRGTRQGWRGKGPLLDSKRFQLAHRSATTRGEGVPYTHSECPCGASGSFPKMSTILPPICQTAKSQTVRLRVRGGLVWGGRCSSDSERCVVGLGAMARKRWRWTDSQWAAFAIPANVPLRSAGLPCISRLGIYNLARGPCLKTGSTSGDRTDGVPPFYVAWMRSRLLRISEVTVGLVPAIFRTLRSMLSVQYHSESPCPPKRQ